MGRECNSESECLASMHKALGSSPEEGRKERRESKGWSDSGGPALVAFLSL